MVNFILLLLFILSVFLAGALFHAKNGEKFDKFVEWIMRWIDYDR